MWFFINQIYYVAIDFLAIRINGVLRWFTIGNLGLLLIDITNSNTNVPGLVWANLAFIAALIFNAGVTVNRIKSLEARMQDAENERSSVKLASLETAVRHMEDRLNGIHKSVHDLRNDIHKSGMLRAEKED